MARMSLAPTTIPSAHMEGSDIECPSFDGPVSDGKFRTHNVEKDEIQRFTVTDRDSGSYFKNSCRIVSCIHGHLEEDEGIAKRPGTLLVLEYRLQPKPGHRFSYVYTSFTFKDVPGAAEGERASPEVIAYAPFRRPRNFDKTEANKTHHSGLYGKLGASGGAMPGTGEVGADFSSEETHLQQYFAKGAASIQYNDKTGLDDTVWWTLEQNKNQNLGVLPVFRVAVLLERSSLADFVGVFKMDVHGSFTHRLSQVGSSIDRFLRRFPVDDPINFSPQKKPLQGKTDGISQHKLLSLVDDKGDGDSLYLPDSYHIESFLPR